MTQADLSRWGGRRYYSLDCCLRDMFGEKVYKITLNGGMSCPNRDGHIGTGGCIFCSAKGSGDFAGNAALSVTEQLAAGKKDLLAKSSRKPYRTRMSGLSPSPPVPTALEAMSWSFSGG